MSNITQVLASHLQAAIDAPNHAQVMADCEQVYSALFRSDDAPVRAGDLDSDDISSRFTFDAAVTDDEIPSSRELDLDIDDEEDHKEYDRICANFQHRIVITEDTLMIETCNYKGEGEGFVPFESVKNNPVFRSKFDSFSDFGV